MSLETKEFYCIDALLANEETFSISMQVRDYECDMQGIVNNTVYMHYLEHARHEFLNKCGLNWKKLIDSGIYLVALSAEIEYKKPLVPGDTFTVTCKMTLDSRFKIKFIHEIFNVNRAVVLKGTMTAAFIDKDKKPILVEKVIGEKSR